MALGFAINKQIPKHLDLRKKIVTITMDTDYPTGGWPLTAANFQLNQIVALIPLGSLDGYTPVWDRTNSKLKMMMSDLSESTDGPFVECDNGRNDLADKTILCLVYGF